MNKLKKKVFYTIFLILTLTSLSFISTYNISKYMEQRKNINNSLEIVSNNKEDKLPMDKPTPDKEPLDRPNKIDENTKFMDSTIYTILINEDNTIKEIINHSNNNISDTEIMKIATTILNDKNIKTKYIGNLYLKDYSYSYNKGDSLVILDNTAIKHTLTSSLINSLIISILLELLIILISKEITKWITIPVKNSFEKQKQFIEDASHELKTPLSVIIASTEALENNPKEKKWLNNIKSESSRMSNLISDLLELASSEKSEMYALKENNLSKIVELSVLTFEVKAYEENVKLKYDIEENIQMKLDEDSIKQLVEILLDNAIKHSTKKETVTLSLTNINNSIVLSITNKGSEIPKGEEEKIFERFYRVDKSRNRKENRYGLGLAIAKNIVINHHGKIMASSTAGTTTFKVLFKK